MAGRAFSVLVFLFSALAMGFAAVSAANGSSYQGNTGGRAQSMLGYYLPYDNNVTGWDALSDNVVAAILGGITLIFAVTTFLLNPDPKSAKVFSHIAFYDSLGFLALVGYQAYFYIVAGRDGPNNLGDVLDFCRIGGGSQFASSFQQELYGFGCNAFRIEFGKFIFIIITAVSLMFLSSSLSSAPVPFPAPIYELGPILRPARRHESSP